MQQALRVQSGNISFKIVQRRLKVRSKRLLSENVSLGERRKQTLEVQGYLLRTLNFRRNVENMQTVTSFTDKM